MIPFMRQRKLSDKSRLWRKKSTSSLLYVLRLRYQNRGAQEASGCKKGVVTTGGINFGSSL